MMNNMNVMSELDVLNAALAVGWVKFSYTKADGSKRIAIGTRNKNLIETILGRPLEERKSKSYYNNCNGYFDLSRGDWRQFNKDRFGHMMFDNLTNEQAVSFALAIALSFDIPLVDFVRVKAISFRLIGESETERINKLVYGRITCGLDDFDEISKECDRVVKIATFGSGSVLGRTTTAAKPKTNREELIAELLKIRQRESEILAELLK